MRRSLALAVAGLVAAGPLTLAVPAQASGGSDAVVRTGSCSGRSDWKLKAKHDDGRIEWELEIDTPRIGRAWRVRVYDNTVLVFAGTRTTLAPSGSFTVERRTANRAGLDYLVARARNLANGELCRARVTV